MRAVRLDAVRKVSTRETETHEPRPDELVLRVEACGVCGTDRHMVQGEYPARLPVTLGHEFAGTVIDGGAGTAPVAGTRVAVDPNISCGRCRACRRGDVALCPNRVALGV